MWACAQGRIKLTHPFNYKDKKFYSCVILNRFYLHSTWHLVQSGLKIFSKNRPFHIPNLQQKNRQNFTQTKINHSDLKVETFVPFKCQTQNHY